MKYLAFSLLNEETQTYEGIQLYRTEGLAARVLAESIVAAKRDPSGFRLYKIGEFDNETNIFVCLPTPVLVPFSTSARVEAKMDEVEK